MKVLWTEDMAICNVSHDFESLRQSGRQSLVWPFQDDDHHSGEHRTQTAGCLACAVPFESTVDRSSRCVQKLRMAHHDTGKFSHAQPEGAGAEMAKSRSTSTCIAVLNGSSRSRAAATCSDYVK